LELEVAYVLLSEGGFDYIFVKEIDGDGEGLLIWVVCKEIGRAVLEGIIKF
jgi:hypothetical protein